MTIATTHHTAPSAISVSELEESLKETYSVIDELKASLKHTLNESQHVQSIAR